MDLGQIEAFVQVSTHNSFSRAAEVLQLPQPSITARIQSLERELGEEMFERGGRGVRLTDCGLAFLPYAERILQTVGEGGGSIAAGCGGARPPPPPRREMGPAPLHDEEIVPTATPPPPSPPGGAAAVAEVASE